MICLKKSLKFHRSEKLRKKIGKKVNKVRKYFNSDLVSKFIIDKTLGINPKSNIYGKIKKF